MSVNKWRYTIECDNDYCPGDCDYCGKNEEEAEHETDYRKE